ALAGYVVGGIIGRQLRRSMGHLEDRVERVPAGQLLMGTLGGAALAALAALVGLPAIVLIPGHWGWPIFGLLVWVGLWAGFRVGVRQSRGLLALAGLSERSLLVDATGAESGAGPEFLLDTSAIIDGRLLTVSDAGFLHGSLLVPRFVLDELQ